MEAIEEYAKIVEKELNDLNCFFKSISIDNNVFNSSKSVFIHIDLKQDDIDIKAIRSVLMKYKFTIVTKVYPSTLLVYSRKVDDILDELRVEGLKELLTCS